MKKLILKKEVIAQLNNRQMGNIHGGGLTSLAAKSLDPNDNVCVLTSVGAQTCTGTGTNPPISAGPGDPICESILGCDALSKFVCPSPPPPANTSIPYINCGG